MYLHPAIMSDTESNCGMGFNKFKILQTLYILLSYIRNYVIGHKIDVENFYSFDVSSSGF